jgi:hypothetical protein
MSFLKPHIEYATTESNVSSIDLENEEDDISHEDVGSLLATARTTTMLHKTQQNQDVRIPTLYREMNVREGKRLQLHLDPLIRTK